MDRNIVLSLKLAVIFWVAIFIFGSCATNPVTGKKELSLLSNSQEIQLGAEADPGIVAQYGLYDDPKIAKYVDELGQKMAKISHRPTLQFHFRVLDSPVINAFALPGGYVYITRGILAYMNSEAELAGVIGHEIGHITARHGAKAYTRAQLAQVGFGVGYLFSETFRQFSDVAQMGVGLLFLRFSRDQERQSDELGVAYSTKVGYDATHMSHFFGTLSNLRGLSGTDSGGALESWFSTHPDPHDREAKTLQLAKQEQAKAAAKGFKAARDHYLNLIDGIVFGEDPRQGFVENGVFYHPTLEFQFPVPQGWQLINTPQQVQMVNKEQTAGMQFTLSQQPSARKSADKFVSDSKGQVTASDYQRLHGLNVEIREVLVASQQGDLKVLAYFIEKDRYVYSFLGISGANNYSKNVGAFRYTMNNFQRLKNQKAKTVKPTRIKVVRVNRTTTLQNFLKRYPNKTVSAEKLAIINGKNLTDKLQRGERVKVLTK